MGFDVYGRAPSGKEGVVFSTNVAGWGPLVRMLKHLCAEEIAPCKGWHTNDGHGLEGSGAVKLAERLRQLTEIGLIEVYCAQDATRVANLPDESCLVCKGAGRYEQHISEIRMAPEALNLPMPPPSEVDSHGVWRGVCPVCGGSGRRQPDDYSLDPETVAEFCAFLAQSGGFEIW